MELADPTIEEPVNGAGHGDEHAVDGAAYRREITGLMPIIFCLCGHEASGEIWAEAGAAYDAHLQEHKPS